MELNISDDDIIPAKGSVTLVGKITPEKVGRINGKISIKTDHPDATRLRISVYGNAREQKDKSKAQAVGSK